MWLAIDGAIEETAGMGDEASDWRVSGSDCDPPSSSLSASAALSGAGGETNVGSALKLTGEGDWRGSGVAVDGGWLCGES